MSKTGRVELVYQFSEGEAAQVFLDEVVFFCDTLFIQGQIARTLAPFLEESVRFSVFSVAVFPILGICIIPDGLIDLRRGQIAGLPEALSALLHRFLVQNLLFLLPPGQLLPRERHVWSVGRKFEFLYGIVARDVQRCKRFAEHLRTAFGPYTKE